MPAIPTITPPPTLSANYSDPDTGDTGTTNYRISSSSLVDCTNDTNIVASGTSLTTSDNNENTTWTPGSSIGSDATYYWCAQNDDGVAQSAWTQMGNFILDTQAPAILTLSPADNATGVAVDSNLVITFSSVVDAETGNISLYKTTGDVLVQTFDVTADISGSGTDTITINPTDNLLDGTSYYVKIDATAFDDVASNSYAGISDATTWNFTTVDNTAPVPVRSVSTGSGGGLPTGRGNQPKTPAGGFKIAANQSANKTSSRIVNLKFNAGGSNIAKMAISLKGDFSDAIQENYSPTKKIDLCSKFGSIKRSTCPDGEYTIYVKFYTNYGVPSDVVTTKINLVSSPQFSKNLRTGVTNTTNQQTKNPSAVFATPLYTGLQSADVRRLQALLATKPEFYPEGKITGYFGLLTKRAVQKFQSNYILVNSPSDPAFGYVGQKTRAKLQEVFGK